MRRADSPTDLTPRIPPGRPTVEQLLAMSVDDALAAYPLLAPRLALRGLAPPGGGADAARAVWSDPPSGRTALEELRESGTFDRPETFLRKRRGGSGGVGFGGAWSALSKITFSPSDMLLLESASAVTLLPSLSADCLRNESDGEQPPADVSADDGIGPAGAGSAPLRVWTEVDCTWTWGRRIGGAFRHFAPSW
eukprot:gene34904-43624_t